MWRAYGFLASCSPHSWRCYCWRYGTGVCLCLVSVIIARHMAKVHFKRLNTSPPKTLENIYWWWHVKCRVFRCTVNFWVRISCITSLHGGGLGLNHLILCSSVSSKSLSNVLNVFIKPLTNEAFWNLDQADWWITENSCQDVLIKLKLACWQVLVLSFRITKKLEFTTF